MLRRILSRVLTQDQTCGKNFLSIKSTCWGLCKLRNNGLFAHTRMRSLKRGYPPQSMCYYLCDRLYECLVGVAIFRRAAAPKCRPVFILSEVLK